MRKEKIVIFGAGGSGRTLYKQFTQKAEKNWDIVAFADTYKSGDLFGLPILKPKELLEVDCDKIVIASVAAKSVRQELLELGIAPHRIVASQFETGEAARDTFLRRLAQEMDRRNIMGAVAEAGVYQGDFATLMNESFPLRKLYLFDTFIGFDDRDLEKEDGYEKNSERGEHFKETSVEFVMSRMQHPQNVIIKQGYVPETFHGIEETFAFVNLDMDLYQPTLAALEWFWPHMVSHGVILVHDYFDESGSFPNLKKAVIQFTEAHKIHTLPIGDNLSIALVRENE